MYHVYSQQITRMHGSVLRCVRSHSRMDYGKFDHSVNRKWRVRHKHRNMLSLWSSKHVVSRTDVPFGGYNIQI